MSALSATAAPPIPPASANVGTTASASSTIGGAVDTAAAVAGGGAAPPLAAPDADGNDCSVRVCVRIRPLLSHEAGQSVEIRTTSNANQLECGTKKGRAKKHFTFDHLCGMQSSQDGVYECVKPLVGNVLAGKNATVFAYGQTGSGKSYTMGTTCATDDAASGTGVIPKAMRDMFARIEAAKEQKETRVVATFVEIYGNEIKDLLAGDAGDPYDGTHSIAGLDERDYTPNSKAKRLAALRKQGCKIVSGESTKDKTAQVTGCVEVVVGSAAEAMAVLSAGTAHRTTGGTKMNSHSSRSHAVFTVKVVTQDLTQPGRPPVVARFHFCDLAGSERAKRTGATGKRLQEGININLGLSTLGNVINALGDPDSKVSRKAIPYRQSKLTYMLKSALGGNSKTLMICCVSPAADNLLESLNALRYANRARNIKNQVVVNHDHDNAEMSAMLAKIAALEEALHTGRGCAIRMGGLNSWTDEDYEQMRNQVKISDKEVERLNAALAARDRTISDLRTEHAHDACLLVYHQLKAKGVDADAMDGLLDGAAAADVLGGEGGGALNARELAQVDRMVAASVDKASVEAELRAVKDHCTALELRIEHLKQTRVIAAAGSDADTAATAEAVRAGREDAARARKQLELVRARLTTQNAIQAQVLQDIADGNGKGAAAAAARVLSEDFASGVDGGDGDDDEDGSDADEAEGTVADADGTAAADECTDAELDSDADARAYAADAALAAQEATALANALDAQVKRTEAALELAADENEKRRQQKAVADKKIAALEREIAMVGLEKDRFVQELAKAAASGATDAAAEAHKAGLKRKIAEQEAKIKKLRQNAKMHEATRHELAQKESAFKRQQQALQELKNRKVEAQKRIARINREHAAFKAERKRQILQMKKQKRKDDAARARLDRQIKREQRVNQQKLDKYNAQIKRQRRAAERKLDAARVRFDQTQRKHERTLTAANKKTRVAQRRAETTMSKAKAKLAERDAAAKKQTKAHHKQLSDERKARQAVRREKQRMMKQLQDKDQAVAALTRKLEAIERKNKAQLASRRQMAAQRKKGANYKKQLAQQKDQLAELRKALADKQAELAAAQARHKAEQAQLNQRLLAEGRGSTGLIDVAGDAEAEEEELQTAVSAMEGRVTRYAERQEELEWMIEFSEDKEADFRAKIEEANEDEDCTAEDIMRALSENGYSDKEIQWWFVREFEHRNEAHSEEVEGLRKQILALEQRAEAADDHAKRAVHSAKKARGRSARAQAAARSAQQAVRVMRRQSQTPASAADIAIPFGEIQGALIASGQGKKAQRTLSFGGGGGGGGTPAGKRDSIASVVGVPREELLEALKTQKAANTAAAAENEALTAEVAALKASAEANQEAVAKTEALTAQIAALNKELEKEKKAHGKERNLRLHNESIVKDLNRRGKRSELQKEESPEPKDDGFSSVDGDAFGSDKGFDDHRPSYARITKSRRLSLATTAREKRRRKQGAKKITMKACPENGAMVDSPAPAKAAVRRVARPLSRGRENVNTQLAPADAPAGPTTQFKASTSNDPLFRSNSQVEQQGSSHIAGAKGYGVGSSPHPGKRTNMARTPLRENDTLASLYGGR